MINPSKPLRHNLFPSGVKIVIVLILTWTLALGCNLAGFRSTMQLTGLPPEISTTMSASGTMATLPTSSPIGKESTSANTPGLPQSTIPLDWNDLGPNYGGRLSAILASTSDPNQLLVGSPGGGLWKTTDNGKNWGPASSGLEDFNVYHLAWDAFHPGRALAVTNSDLYASMDFGGTWEKAARPGPSGPAPVLPAGVDIWGQDPLLFSQAQFSTGGGVILFGRPCSGLYYSFDGNSFQQLWPFDGGSENPDNCLSSIAVDPATGRVFLSTAKRGVTVVRSKSPWSAGSPVNEWESVESGLPEDGWAIGLVSAGRPDRLAALMQTTDTKSSVYLTTDGAHWSPAASLPTPNWSPRPILYGGGDQLFVGDVAAYQSTDFGRTWAAFAANGVFPDGREYSVHVDVRSIYAYAYSPTEGYVWYGSDGTLDIPKGYLANINRWDWTPGTAPRNGIPIGVNGLRVWQMYTLAAIPRGEGVPPRLLIGSQDNSALCSDDGGATWGFGAAISGGDVFSILAVPSDPNRVYIINAGTGAIMRADNAQSAASCADVAWQFLPLSLGVSSPWSHDIAAVDPKNPDTLYLSTYQGVAVSTDGGHTFRASGSRPGGALPVTLYLDGTGLLYAGTVNGGSYLSKDDGQTWTPFGPPAALNEVVTAFASSLGSSPNAPFFIATTNGLYRREANGDWVRVLGGPNVIVSDVKIDPTCPSTVYAALGFGSFLGQQPGGAFVSTDSGQTWSRITAGSDLNWLPVAELVPFRDGAGLDLFAASYGRGTWSTKPSFTCQSK
jgi:hypothetical protein